MNAVVAGGRLRVVGRDSRSFSSSSISSSRWGIAVEVVVNVVGMRYLSSFSSSAAATAAATAVLVACTETRCEVGVCDWLVPGGQEERGQQSERSGWILRLRSSFPQA